MVRFCHSMVWSFMVHTSRDKSSCGACTRVLPFPIMQSVFILVNPYPAWVGVVFLLVGYDLRLLLIYTTTAPKFMAAVPVAVAFRITERSDKSG